MKLLFTLLLAFLTTHLDASPLITQEGQPSKPLLELLALTKIQHDNTLAGIVAATQEAWKRPSHLERADLVDSPLQISQRAEILDLASQLGFIEHVAPSQARYTYGAWLGGFLGAVRVRLEAMAHDWEAGIRFPVLVVLTGERSLRNQPGEMEDAAVLCDSSLFRLPPRQGWQPPQVMPQTETEMMQIVWDQVELPRGMRESLEVVVIDTPRGEKMRPNTEDTYLQWLKQAQPIPGTILAYSNQPFVPFQQEVGVGVLPPAYPLDTVGPSAYYGMKVSVLLDSIARTLWQLQKNEPLPKGRGVYLGGVSTSPKFGRELPVPEGPGFGSLDE